MYRVKGADQKEYGPVSLDQVRQWIQEGRLNRFSLLQKEGDALWKPLEQYSECGDLLTPSPAPTAAVVTAEATVADPQQAAGRLKVPALLILILSALGIVLTLGGLLMKGALIDALLQAGFPLDANVRSQLEQAKSVGIGVMDIFQMALGIGINVLTLVGAVKMMRLQNWGLAMTSAILIMLPCAGCCCLLGLPVGIWALVTLNKPEIKSAFR